MIRAGFDAEVDECRRLADGGKDEILAIEARERERTGIATLKVRYNRVFGYYIEITKTHLAKVPAHYVRKQTLANAERYVTPELAEFERKVLDRRGDARRRARPSCSSAEVARGRRGRARSLARPARALAVARRAARSLAEVARAPRLLPARSSTTALALDIADGRHPVVEAMLPRGQRSSQRLPARPRRRAARADHRARTWPASRRTCARSR